MSPFIKDQRKIFDNLYETKAYDVSFGEEGGQIRQMFKRIQPRHILNIGSGRGYSDWFMAEHPFVETVHGIDYSEKAIELSQKEYPHPKVTRTVTDLFDFVPDRKFDLVYAAHVIEHLEDPVRFLHCCGSLCRADGHIVIVTPNQLRWENRLRLLLGKKPTMENHECHFREYSIREMRDFFRTCHLDLVHYLSTSFAIYFVTFGYRSPFFFLGKKIDVWLQGLLTRLLEPIFPFYGSRILYLLKKRS